MENFDRNTRNRLAGSASQTNMVHLTPEERRNECLSDEHLQLATLLLMCNGFVILRGAMPSALVDDMKREYDAIIHDCESSLPGKSLEKIPWQSVGNTIFWIANARLRAFIRMKGSFSNYLVVANPFAVAILENVLGANFFCNSVSSDTCLAGSSFQSPHRDIGFYPNGQTRGTIVNVPLMHCGLHNGPLEIWPGGSHLWKRETFAMFDMRAFDQDVANPPMELFARRLPSVKVELEPGDLLLRDPGALHRGTPNPTREPRIMLTIGYFREGEKYPFGDPAYNLDHDIFESLHPHVRKLMEFRYRSRTNYPALYG
ncbi:phytanoyl-CoA dioxygenase family protein [Ideonella sp. 4Y16]|uniref:Phytanoyl-CoA dioxygenase family protein n=1 Tax=Ideonella alba TaxID=2824118 RepID=A0A941BHV3_9BURK|nr:phytanoyl-CoA dioxygenase family protein [Ideonella alba]MBQ0933557.1 phytanoyl-CoA dioxygenase family protein [Ideonella alba]MBQ0946554.1 phytanoyl-CoA dioxygenase family protein [Ideonella alba]